MLPPRLLRLFRQRREQMVIQFTDTELVALRWGPETTEEVGRVPLSGLTETEQRTLVHNLLASTGNNGTPMTLLLPPECALRKRVSLPAAAEENLEQVLGFEMDRQTPFRTEDIYFDYKVHARHSDLKRIVVDLVVVPRAIVDQTIERCGRLGLAPNVASVTWHQQDNPNVINLLPKAQPTPGQRRSKRIASALGIIAFVMLAAAIYVPLERQRSLAANLATEVEGARIEAEAVRQLREQVDQALEQGQLIVLKKVEHPSLIQLLDEVTRLLGDETWLIRLRYHEGEMQIFGYSGAASMLIGAIEDSLLFQDAQFRAPVTRDPAVDAERFHIAFQVVPQLPRLADSINSGQQDASR